MHVLLNELDLGVEVIIVTIQEAVDFVVRSVVGDVQRREGVVVAQRLPDRDHRRRHDRATGLRPFGRGLLNDFDLGVDFGFVSHQCIFRIIRIFSFVFSLIERSISIGSG